MGCWPSTRRASLPWRPGTRPGAARAATPSRSSCTRSSPPEPILVRGSLRLVADFTRTVGFSPLTFSVGVRAASGLPYQARFGLLEPGTSTYTVDLPPCKQDPCTLMSFAFTQPVGIPATTIGGEVVLHDAADAAGPIDLTSGGPNGWRQGASSGSVPVPGGASVESSAGGRLTVTIDKAPIDDAAVEVADHPIALPMLQGSDQPVQEASGPFAVGTGLDSRFIPATIEGVGVLPRLLTLGNMADLRYAIDATATAFDPLDYQVWLSPTATPEVRAKLASLDVISTESLATTEAELSRSGPALALRLFLLAAVVALVLGAGTLLANAYVVIRRRAYELAALRALGADRRVLVRSARREQMRRWR